MKNKHWNSFSATIGQLKVANSSASSESRGYVYDAAWNLNVLTNNGSTSTFLVDGKNELTNAASAVCTYDAGGNMLTKGNVTYTYNDENRLATVITNGSSFGTSFFYDGLGRLREQFLWSQGELGGGSETESAGRGGFGLDTGIGFGGGSSLECPFPGDGWILAGGICYVYDGNRVIQERAYYGSDPTVSYTRGNDLSGTLEGAGGIGGLLARSDSYVSGSFTNHDYYHADGNGNITYLETYAQTTAAVYRYDAFGNALGVGGVLGAANTYRFSSKEWVPAASAYYYLYRFYDPSIQRWLNRDPIGEDGGVNLYEMVNNSPIKNFDKFGLMPPDCKEEQDKLDQAQEKLDDDRREKGNLAARCNFDMVMTGGAITTGIIGIGVAGAGGEVTPVGVVGIIGGGVGLGVGVYGMCGCAQDGNELNQLRQKMDKDRQTYKHAARSLQDCQAKAKNPSKPSPKPRATGR